MLTVITQSEDFYQRLATAYFSKQSILSIYFDGTLHPDTTSVLLIEPYLVGEEWLLLRGLWLKYFIAESSSIKLITAQFSETTTANELNLLNLPRNLVASIDAAAPVTRWSTQELAGLTLAGKFRKFLDGHGEESLLKLITQLRSSFDTALFMLDDGYDFDEVWETMLKVIGEQIGKQLVERWEKYRPYFKPTPFYNRLQAYDRQMFDRLVSFFTTNPTEEAVRELTPKLTELSQFLREIDELLN